MNLELAIKTLVNHKVATDIVQAVREEYEDCCDDWSWTCGGCFAFAEAIVLAVPSAELWAVGQKDEEDWASQHAFAKYQNKFFDADGRITEAQLLKRYGWKSSPVKIGNVKQWIDQPDPNALWYPQQEFVTEAEIKKLAKQLKQIIKELM